MNGWLLQELVKGGAVKGVVRLVKAWFGLWQELVKGETVDALSCWMVGSGRSA